MGNLAIAELDTGSNLWRTSNCTTPRLPFLHMKSNSSPTSKKKYSRRFSLPQHCRSWAGSKFNFVWFSLSLLYWHQDTAGLRMSICALWIWQALKVARKTDSKTQCFGTRCVRWRCKLTSLYFWEIKYKIWRTCAQLSVRFVYVRNIRTKEKLGSIQAHSLWDLCRTNWQWGRYFS
jgi:hypothetical protein